MMKSKEKYQNFSDMTPYELWQIEKFGKPLNPTAEAEEMQFGRIVPEDEPDKEEFENRNIESTEECEWLEKKSDEQLNDNEQ